MRETSRGHRYLFAAVLVAALLPATAGCSSDDKPSEVSTSDPTDASDSSPPTDDTAAPTSDPVVELVALPPPTEALCAGAEYTTFEGYLPEGDPGADSYVGLEILTVYGIDVMSSSYDFEVSAGNTGYMVFVRGGKIAEFRTYDISLADDPGFQAALQRLLGLYFTDPTMFPASVILNAMRDTAGGPWTLTNCTFDPERPMPPGE
ncbi:MAG: hypothetical protein Q7V57_00565 [Actinomycetota bacterium]|nr:hypothetical protein [Actinomycetota bacterium]